MEKSELVAIDWWFCSNAMVITNVKSEAVYKITVKTCLGSETCETVIDKKIG